VSIKHPITPPPELVARLWREASEGRIYVDEAPIGEIFNHGVYLAYQAGADMELEACCEWMEFRLLESAPGLSQVMRAARRPKVKTLNQRARYELAATLAGGNITPERAAIIRIALEEIGDATN